MNYDTRITIYQNNTLYIYSLHHLWEVTQAHDKHYNKWEKKIFKDLPSPEPYSWKKFLKQCAIQLVLMAVAMLYMKFYMQPKLETDLAKQMEILEQKRLAELRANQTDFSALGDGEFEVGFPNSTFAHPHGQDRAVVPAQVIYEHDIL